MSTPFQPVISDAQTLAAQGVMDVKTFVDALLGQTEAELPILSGDALTSACAYLESVVPPSVAPELTAILSANTASIQPFFSSLSTAAQVALVYAQSQADAFLAKL
jgi:hypothetical protein